jgi:hypothetical protein
LFKLHVYEPLQHPQWAPTHLKMANMS